MCQSLPSTGCQSTRELTENIPNWAYYPQLGILSPIGDLKSLIRDNISVWGRVREQITNPQLIRYTLLGISNTQFGILYPIGYFLLLVLYYVSPAEETLSRTGHAVDPLPSVSLWLPDGRTYQWSLHVQRSIRMYR